MATEIRRVTFEEFAADVAGFFDRVTHDKETIVVERGPGNLIVMKPARAAKARRRKKTQADHEAFLASTGSWGDVDIDVFLKNVYESRSVASRPPVEP